MITWSLKRGEIEGRKERQLMYWVFSYTGRVECVVWSETNRSKGKAIAAFKEKKGTRKR